MMFSSLPQIAGGGGVVYRARVRIEWDFVEDALKGLDGVPSSISAAVISAPVNPNFRISHGDNGYPIGNNLTYLTIFNFNRRIELLFTNRLIPPPQNYKLIAFM
ncbi:hypothetical protein QL285_024630 [Trifolium repens]|nr:hypothetical protein QL285_024630 [Trifolium repens]